MKTLVLVPTIPERSEMLREAIESVHWQTRAADEITVLPSIQNGKSIPFDVRVNRAIERSNCDAFTILADDDKLSTRFIERTTDAMEREGVDIVYTNCHIFGNRLAAGAALGEWNKENIDRNTVPLCTALCRKSAWERAGKYVAVPYYDWDFWWRCFYTGSTAYWLKEPLFWWRDHSASGTATENHDQSRSFILKRHEELKRCLSLQAN